MSTTFEDSGFDRRWFLQAAVTPIWSCLAPSTVLGGSFVARRRVKEIRIKRLKITPIALPDPPILAASGCHGPYFLRTVLELETDAGIVGVGETHGGESFHQGLRAAAKRLVGKSVFAYLQFAEAVKKVAGVRGYAGVELACLDVLGKASHRRLCELLGGPVRDPVPFASYLFFRYAADHPAVLNDPRLADQRGKGDSALDDWGEVRTPQAMADMAEGFHKRWGFTVHKLKAGVLPPDTELAALRAINDRFGGKHQLRIDPNGRWTEKTAVRIGKQLVDLPLEYYEDPVAGQQAMASVRRQTGLTMSTNSCVTQFAHIPRAIQTKPIDIVLCDHHFWGGIPACQALGAMAGPLGWRLGQHSNNHGGVTMAAMIHLSAIVPQLTSASDTHYVWLPDDADIIAGGKLKIEGGQMKVPTAPGVGVTLDRDQLARAHETYQKCGIRSRNDAATMQRFEPGWRRTMF